MRCAEQGLALLCVFALFPWHGAHAATGKIEAARSTWVVAWGVSYDASRIDLRWGGDVGPVGRIDARGDLNLKPFRHLALPELHWIPAEGPAWSFVSQRFGGESTARIDRELEVDGQRFPLDAEARLTFVFEGGTLGWTWWHLDDDPGHSLGLGLGIAHYRFRSSIQLRAGDGDGGEDRFGEGHLSGAIWLPQARLTQQWRTPGGYRAWWEVQGLMRPEGSIRGHVLEARAGIDLWGEGGTGLGLRWRGIDIDLRRDWVATGRGALRYRAHGPELVLMARWN